MLPQIVLLGREPEGKLIHFIILLHMVLQIDQLSYVKLSLSRVAFLLVNRSSRFVSSIFNNNYLTFFFYWQIRLRFKPWSVFLIFIVLVIVISSVLFINFSLKAFRLDNPIVLNLFNLEILGNHP